MQVSMETDYALSILCLIAQRKDFVRTSEIIRTVGGSGEYMRRLLVLLRDANMITYTISKKNSSNRGYILAKPPEQISLLDIINATEKTMDISRFLKNNGGLCHTAMDYKKINVVFGKIRKNILLAFAKVTIADFLHCKIVNDIP